MITTDFTQLNESLKTFILSVSFGSQAVIDSLVDTANRHLEELNRLNIATLNVKLHFQCSVSITESKGRCGSSLIISAECKLI